MHQTIKLLLAAIIFHFMSNLFITAESLASDVELVCQERQKIGYYYSESEKSWKPTLMDPSELSFVLRKPEQKDKETLEKFREILPPGPHAFIAVTNEVGLIFNACPIPPNEGGFMECDGSGKLKINIKTGRFTKYSSDVFYVFAWENKEKFDFVEPISIAVGDCQKLR